METSVIDINETSLRESNPAVLSALLRCHSSWRNAGKPENHEADYNIIWATDDYVSLGEGYGFHDRITPDLITGEERGNIIRPRVLKTSEEQSRRVKNKAEVFTPSWVCNEQNNLVDEAWFGRKDVFNVPDNENRTWQTNPDKIEFPEGKTWIDYVCARRMEMCCGEAPYLVSRYDTVSGEPIRVTDRIGLLDRKLRVISENVDNTDDWLAAALYALKAIYGFEWQGDSLLLAREAVLYSAYDFYEVKFGEEFPEKEKQYLAYVISWNLFQMDGLKMVVPGSCGYVNTLLGRTKEPCKACKAGTRMGHNGIPALLPEWPNPKVLRLDKSKLKVAKPFSDSLKKSK